MTETLEAINQLKRQMQLSVLGQEHVVDSLIITMLANGNLLLEGLPGTAKTRSIKTMASVMEVDLGSIGSVTSGACGCVERLAVGGVAADDRLVGVDERTVVL